ncbi:GerMN domain-containing protein [Actinoplanes sp. NPDC051633]|uniref:GerMN domain-containing protein n=1 Tax=Actinoplanes sp. NPDC051633 TaxID=3155670 RepID=UPI0034327DBE
MNRPAAMGVAMGVAMAVIAVVGACGVTAQDEPHAVELPRRPLTTAAPGSAFPGPPGEVAEVLCLVRDGRLVEVVRRVKASPSAQEQVDQLLAGPTEAERNSGITTALTGLSLTVSLRSGRGESEVEVAEANEDAARSDETIAYGQVVCTLTSRSDVVSVIFTQDGDRLEVPRADGSLSRGPLYGSDFAALVAER